MKGLMLFEEGFEDSEGLSSRALLRRAAIDIDSVTTGESKVVKSGYGVKILVDYTLDEVNLDDYDFLVVPGGPYVARIFDKSSKVIDTIKHFFNQKKLIGAICAAPRLLGHWNMLRGLEFTCYPGCEEDCKGAIYRPDQKVIVTDYIITAKSSGYVIDFVYEIVAKLFDRKKADALLDHLVWKR